MLNTSDLQFSFVRTRFVRTTGFLTIPRLRVDASSHGCQQRRDLFTSNLIFIKLIANLASLLRSFVWTACGQTGSGSMIPQEEFGMSFRDCHGVSKCCRTVRYLEIQGIFRGVVSMDLLSQSVNRSVHDVHGIRQRTSVIYPASLDWRTLGVECALLGCFRSLPFASTPLRLGPPLGLNALKMLNLGIIKGVVRVQGGATYIYTSTYDTRKPCPSVQNEFCSNQHAAPLIPLQSLSS